MDESIIGPYVYVLEGQTPVPEMDWGKWSDWYDEADRRVKLTVIGEYEVSTVFLGVDYNLFGDEPVLFETLVTGGQKNNRIWRYTTWEEAEAGHDRVVAKLTGGNDEQG